MTVRQRGSPNRYGAWTWHQDPRAIHYDGVTYIGYVHPDGSIMLGAYDHADGAFQETTVRDRYTTTTHAAPAITIRDDERIVVWYARRSDEVRFKISDGPLDPTGFEDDSADELYFNTTGTASFTNPVQTPSGDLYCFYRVSSGENYNQFYRRSESGGDGYGDGSTDVGEYWTDEIQLVDTGNTRAYCKKSLYDGDIHISIHSSNNQSTGNLDWVAHVILDPETREFREIDGADLGTEADLPLTEPDLTKIVEGQTVQDQQLRVWDILVENGTPYLLISDLDNPENHQYRRLHWDGSSWQDNPITNGGYGITPNNEYYSGGLCFEGDDPDRVICSRTATDQHEIWRATTSDNGSTWSLEQVTEDSANSNIRPARVHNPHPDMAYVWLFGTFEDLGTYPLRVISEIETNYFRPASDVGQNLWVAEAPDQS